MHEAWNTSGSSTALLDVDTRSRTTLIFLRRQPHSLYTVLGTLPAGAIAARLTVLLPSFWHLPTIGPTLFELSKKVPGKASLLCLNFNVFRTLANI